MVLKVRIKKRDGSYEQWDEDKIKRAMLAAFHDTDPTDVPDITDLVDQVGRQISDEPTVEEVQDIVERVLMGSHPDVAKAYILYREKRSAARRQSAPDATALMDYITVSKYAKYDEGLKRREIYGEIVGRSESMHIRRFPQFEDKIRECFRPVYDKQLLPSMRSMQFGGVAVEANHCRMYNCAFTHMNRLRSFGEILWCLLSGTGVGFSVQFRHVKQLAPTVYVDRSKVRHWDVEDTIEGWADAINELVRSHFITGQYVEFNYSQIRPKGSALKTSGGRAPGHLPLKECIEALRKIFDRAAGRQLRPIEVFDAVCHLAEAVLAGGIRRSSLICIFSIDDFEMMTAKAHGNFDPRIGKNNQRQMANISAFCHRREIKWEQFERLLKFAKEWGEPGFYFGFDPDFGTNPCGEIGLNPVLSDLKVPDTTLDYDWREYKYGESRGRPTEMNEYGACVWKDDKLIREGIFPYSESIELDPVKVYGSNVGFQFCNLCEINGAAITSESMFYRLARMAARIGTLQASYCDFPYLGPVTEAVVRRDALLGVGLTGIMDNPEFTLNGKMLATAAGIACDENEHWAEKLGINPAARVTTVKPGGTAPLVLGCVGSGSTPHHAKRYFRRVTANPLEPQAEYFKGINPHMVEVKPNEDWSIKFCVVAPEDAITVDQLRARDHIEHIFNLYENWIKPGTNKYDDELTHNVSCTIVVDDEDWDDVIEMVWSNRDRVTAMSFMPRIGDKMYPFAPREAITTPADEAEWNVICDLYRPVDWTKFNEESDVTDLRGEVACGGGACDIL